MNTILFITIFFVIGWIISGSLAYILSFFIKYRKIKSIKIEFEYILATLSIGYLSLYLAVDDLIQKKEWDNLNY